MSYSSADEAATMKIILALAVGVLLFLGGLLTGSLLPAMSNARAAFQAKLEKLGYRVESIAADRAGYLVLTYPIPKSVIKLNETSFLAKTQQFGVTVIYQENNAFYFFDCKMSTPDWAVVYTYDL